MRKVLNVFAVGLAALMFVVAPTAASAKHPPSALYVSCNGVVAEAHGGLIEVKVATAGTHLVTYGEGDLNVHLATLAARRYVLGEVVIDGTLVLRQRVECRP